MNLNQRYFPVAFYLSPKFLSFLYFPYKPKQKPFLCLCCVVTKSGSCIGWKRSIVVRSTDGQRWHQRRRETGKVSNVNNQLTRVVFSIHSKGVICVQWHELFVVVFSNINVYVTSNQNLEPCSFFSFLCGVDVFEGRCVYKAG